MLEIPEEEFAALLNQAAAEHPNQQEKQAWAVFGSIIDHPSMLIQLIGGNKKVKDLILKRIQEITSAPGT